MPDKCEICKYHLEIVKELGAAVQESACEKKRKEMWPHIHSKISWKVFWAFVGLIIILIGYIANAQSTIIEKVNVIGTDVQVIKSKIENGGG